MSILQQDDDNDDVGFAVHGCLNMEWNYGAVTIKKLDSGEKDNIFDEFILERVLGLLDLVCC